MPTSASEIILGTINGLSELENARIIVADLISEIAPLLGKYHRLGPDQKVDMSQEIKLRNAISALQLQLSAAHDFDELIALVPFSTRVFQTRSEQAYIGGDSTIHQFLEIPVDNVMGDVMKPPYVSIPLKGEHLISKITCEQAQDFITMRYSDRPITKAEELILERLSALDRYSVLKLWADGYPVHAGYIVELEYIKPCDFPCIEDLGLRYAVRYTTQQEKTYLISEDDKGVKTFNFRAGRCVPDHTCCAKGMWSDQVRREFIKKPVREQEHLQQKDLLRRFRDLHASKQNK